MVLLLNALEKKGGPSHAILRKGQTPQPQSHRDLSQATVATTLDTLDSHLPKPSGCPGNFIAHNRVGFGVLPPFLKATRLLTK